MENREIAALLSQTADLLEIAGEDSFRIRSYRNAASTIESYPERVLDIVRNPERKVTDIPGIGKGIAAVLQEVSVRGSFRQRDELLAKYPPGALELLKIQGLGPKSIAVLWSHFQVSSIDALERLCLDQKLRALPRMGAKLEEKVLKSIAAYRQSSGRFLLSFGRRSAEEIAEHLAQSEGVDSITPAGSLRRGRETIGDLDILITGSGAAGAMNRFASHPKVHQVLGHGENKLSVKYGLEGLQVDVRALPKESYGAAMQYFTGSKDHNVSLRTRAIKMGFTLSEYSLAKVEGGERVAGETEEEIYGKLGLEWIPPELRENCGEIEAAAEGRLPRLIELSDIRGDLHMHTRETDGRATLEEMAAACRDRGYEYIAITDHSKALAMSNGLDEQRTVAFARRVREADGRVGGIRILAGIECDILRDGEMDLAADALAELDYVIGSVHSHMSLEPMEMTDRLLRALECPYLNTIGHPTGRMLLHRDPYPYDFERVAAEAARRKVALEINASPERLDLHGPLLRIAKSKGVKFVVATDAHHPKHLAHMPYGIAMARRGWLERSDVLNTLPFDQFKQSIHKT